MVTPLVVLKVFVTVLNFAASATVAPKVATVRVASTAPTNSTDIRLLTGDSPLRSGASLERSASLHG
jgi:hypothetical protein